MNTARCLTGASADGDAPMSHEKKTWLFKAIRDEILPSYIGINYNEP